MGGFAVITQRVCSIRANDSFLASSVELEIMRRMNHIPGMGLGCDLLGVSEFPHFPRSNEQFGLGYEPKRSDPKKRWRNRAQARAAKEKPMVGCCPKKRKFRIKGSLSTSLTWR
ncbi:hypothetical protein RHMOL_Rhmol08G0166100 [Rhododendron molle]|uniref:Uncharacterized protein n=1 Tax=Rhododendron molle TaxID=49168 RepID=A0ACC0MPS7_RHOML|nr:hypothetical protein RHMOL_Rhmol08G0166100 [Rhododendron molle]